MSQTLANDIFVYIQTQYLQRIFTFILSLIIISFGAQVIAYCAHNIEGSFLGYTGKFVRVCE